MAFTKKHSHRSPYKQVRCTDSTGVKMLHTRAVYYVIEETQTEYLIMFNSRGTQWYAKTRFADLVVQKPKQANQINVNKLF